jgi:hypothetical protein
LPTCSGAGSGGRVSCTHASSAGRDSTGTVRTSCTRALKPGAGLPIACSKTQCQRPPCLFSPPPSGAEWPTPRIEPAAGRAFGARGSRGLNERLFKPQAPAPSNERRPSRLAIPRHRLPILRHRPDDAPRISAKTGDETRALHWQR